MIISDGPGSVAAITADDFPKFFDPWPVREILSGLPAPKAIFDRRRQDRGINPVAFLGNKVLSFPILIRINNLTSPT
jgi:hypothetical protein